ncbi:MAG: transposase [Arachidicoccus sp.]|nr:transposase [Arachidicoccus sp.]
MLRKRALIESANYELKNICQFEHTRHRIFGNFIVDMLSALAADCFFDKKPSINLKPDFIDESKLIAA